MPSPTTAATSTPPGGGQAPTPTASGVGATPKQRRNKSGERGTRAETAVVRYLQAHGWPQAERRRLRGRNDPGDITGTPMVAWSVKGGDAAKLASDELLRKWRKRADDILQNVDADYGILVVQRKGFGPANCGRWWAVMWLSELLNLHAEGLMPWHDALVRLHLADLCALLVAAGYGSLPAGEAS